MRLVLIALVTLASTPAFAVDYTYSVSGKTVAADEALQAALKGKQVMKCTEVTAQANAKGTSIGLKNKK